MAGHRPRVYLLTFDFPPAKGGIQRWMYELAARLPDTDITVFAPAKTGSRRFDAGSSVRVCRVPGAGRGSLSWMFVLAAVVFARSLVRPPDAIVCGHVVTAPVALVVRAVMRVPFLLFVHGLEIRGRRWRRPVDFALRHADIVVANSAFTEDCVRERGVQPARIRLLHPGVDAELYAHRRNSRGTGDPSRVRTILSVSRLDERYKGHDVMLRALPLIRAKCPDVRYTVAGGGVLLGYLRELARSLDVDDAVEFLGEIPDDALPALFSSCDVFVQLSREDRTGGIEGFGIACLEAAAAGKPVIAGRSGGLPSAVCDGDTGLLVDSEDLGAVTDAIVSLLTNHERASEMGQRGRARVERELTWDAMAVRARRIISEVLAEPELQSCASSS